MENIIDYMKLKNPELTLGNIRSKEPLSLLDYYKSIYLFFVYYKIFKLILKKFNIFAIFKLL